MSSEFFLVKRGSTALTNQVITDPNLTYQALAILLQLLCRPDNSPKGYRSLVGRGMGQKAVRNALRELDQQFYRWLVLIHDGKQIRTCVVVCDQPEYDATSIFIEVENRTGMKVLGLSPKDGKNTPNDSKTPSQTDDYPGYASDETVEKTIEKTVDNTDHQPCPTEPMRHMLNVQPSRAFLPKGRTKGLGSKDPKPNQTPRAQEATAASETKNAGGRKRQKRITGAGKKRFERLSAVESVKIKDTDWRLLTECLPEVMQNVEPTAVGDIAQILNRLLAAGWRADRIRNTLAGNQLPAEIRSLAGLVVYRLRQFPNTPPATPSPAQASQEPLESAEQRKARAFTPLALKKRRQAIIEGLPEANQPIGWWFAKYPVNAPSNPSKDASDTTSGDTENTLTSIDGGKTGESVSSGKGVL